MESTKSLACGVATGMVLGILVALGMGSHRFGRRHNPTNSTSETQHDKLRDGTELLPSYPRSRWCRRVMPCTDPRFVAVLRAYGRDALVFLRGPGHAGGYATCVALTDRSDPLRSLNRVPSRADYEAVVLAAAQVAGAFLRLGIFPQLELLGNNSHRFDAEGGVLRMGTALEPFAPHVHVMGRGDPSHCYVEGVPLRGKVPHEVMIPRLRGENWANDAEEIPKVAAALASALSTSDLHPDVRWVERRPNV